MGKRIRICTVAGCINKHYGKGFCKKHHQRHWKNGTLPKSKTTHEIFIDNTDTKGSDCCWNWTAGKDKAGYGKFSRGGEIRAHRYSYKYYYGFIPEGAHILHKCNNKSCVNPKHLYAGSHKDNMGDVAISNEKKGEGSGNNKLTEKQVEEILLSNDYQKNLANKYGVSQEAISLIKCRVTWKHILPDLPKRTKWSRASR